MKRATQTRKVADDSGSVGTDPLDRASDLTFDNAREYVDFIVWELLAPMIDGLMSTHYASAEVPDESGRYLRFGRNPEPDHGEALALSQRAENASLHAWGLTESPFEYEALANTPAHCRARVREAAKAEGWTLLRDVLTDALRALALLLQTRVPQDCTEWEQRREAVRQLREQLREAIDELQLELNVRAGTRPPVPPTEDHDPWRSRRVADAFDRLSSVAHGPGRRHRVCSVAHWPQRPRIGGRRRRTPLACRGARRAPPDESDLPSLTVAGAAA
jgi:hypothetical protein